MRRLAGPYGKANFSENPVAARLEKVARYNINFRGHTPSYNALGNIAPISPLLSRKRGRHWHRSEAKKGTNRGQGIDGCKLGSIPVTAPMSPFSFKKSFLYPSSKYSRRLWQGVHIQKSHCSRSPRPQGAKSTQRGPSDSAARRMGRVVCIYIFIKRRRLLSGLS